MDTDILFRPLQKKDFPKIRTIIDEAWDFDEEYHDEPKTISICLNAYLYRYLAESNYAMVAERDGKVVSFLFGRCDKLSCRKHRIKYIPKLLVTFFKLLFSKDGRQELYETKKTLKTDKELRKVHKAKFDGELCLFATDSHERGRGEGRELLLKFHKFLKENGAKDYFVYTDTYSNYLFYEKHGYSLVSKEVIDFEKGESTLPTYFLYSFDLKNELPLVPFKKP